MRAARADANQPDVIAALRSAGATVQPLHVIGRGCPDLLVGYRGVNLLVEVKDGSRPASARQLTPDQRRWHDEWRGQVDVVQSADQARLLLAWLQRTGNR